MTKHIDLLGLLHIIYGVFLLVILGLSGALMLLSGVLSLAASSGFRDDEAVIMGIILSSAGGVMLVLGLVVGLVCALAGRNLRRRSGTTLAWVAALFAIPTGLLGIGLAVFTFMVLTNDEVKAEFAVERGD